MSQHNSLRVDKVGAKHRNVLTRLERVKKMQELNNWKDRATAYNLPKIKAMKIKVKKTKGPAEEGAAGAAAPAAGAAAPAAAKAAAPKAAAPKPAEKGAKK